MLLNDEEIDAPIKTLEDRKLKLIKLKKLADEVTELEVMSIPAAADLTSGIVIIQRVIVAHYGISMTQIVDIRRMEYIARPRQIAMYFSIHILGAGLSETGRMFNRDHGTVAHAISKVRDLMSVDKAFAAEIQGLEKKCREALAGSVKPDDSSLNPRTPTLST